MISSLSRRLPAWIANDRAALRSRLDAGAFYVFAALLLVNLARVILPDLTADPIFANVTDMIFAAVVLGIGLMLVGAEIPKGARPAVLCFLILLGIYAFGLLLDFSYQGLRHTFAILAAGIIYVFCYTYGARLARSKRILPLLAGVTAILMLHYFLILPRALDLNLTDAFNLTSTIMCGILGCLILTAGMLLILRTASHTRQHLWASLMFAMLAVMGLLFGLRSITSVVLLVYLLYWMFFYILRNRLAGIAMAVSSIVGLFLIVIIAATPFLDSLLGEADRFARGYLGGRLLSGRTSLWSEALDWIAESPWQGQGTGAIIADLEKAQELGPLMTADEIPPDPRADPFDGLFSLQPVTAAPISRELGRLGDLHPAYNTDPRSAHNLFLQIAIQTGLPGLAALTALCLSLFISLISKSGAKIQPLQCYVAACTALFVYLSAFEVFLLQNVLFWGVFAWILMGIGASLVSDRARGKDRPG